MTLDISDADPRGPKAVALPAPPNAPARSAALPDWSRTAKIRIKQTMTWMMMINALTVLLFLIRSEGFPRDPDERFRFERRATDEKPVDVLFPEQGIRIGRL